MSWVIYAGVGLLVALALAGTSKADVSGELPDLSKDWIANSWDAISKYMDGYKEIINPKVGDTVSLSLTKAKKYVAVVTGTIVKDNGDLTYDVRVSTLDSGAGGSEAEMNLPLPSLYKGAPTNSFFQLKA